MFALGPDSNLEGLRPPDALSKDPPEPMQTGRTIWREEVLQAAAFDFDAQ